MLPSVNAQDRSWAIYAHATGLLILTNVPFANVLASLLVWLRVRKDPSMTFARAHAATALNFQVTWTIFTVLFMGLLLAIAFSNRATLLVLLVVAYVALVLLNVLLSIVGCARASDVKGYRYPLAIPFVR
ncbi:MAG TPA: DUF4870 domain-containing protein [Candidatus Aquilonibacter sp.]|nr:DUF4870 domain-containing protein [Candidatus Aquilonibacter sp.]